MKRLLVLILLFCSIFVSESAYGVEPFYDLLPINSEITLLPWEKVDEVLPRKAIFTMIDVESGASFQVQRRAGSKHADIQPLTKEDTRVLKEIYGEWSWKRRAVIVLYEGRTIAASMNGMPHGAGALDNGFNGHFCLHFLNSTTHKTPTPDPAHHLMIMKASGQLDHFLLHQTPDELVDSLMLAINNTDASILKKILTKNVTKTDLKSLSRLSFTKWNVTKSTDKPFEQLLQTKVEVYIKNAGVITTTVEITAKKNPISNRWELEIPSLLKIANH
ncbi:hypothetical protein [Pseudalkalibacillus hwajinpoensis]|uniref:hypothetical protein n=1 Tax=Guptibacillus hwajinpoensis TaxID=208199 RepID=UPI001CD2803E|nr:hypothetical protein [Pseudalkalibacillus hwajinpoensis]MCA0990029.1 hypothetical protein [Pseudalkalibacillus hwajinpoensis]